MTATNGIGMHVFVGIIALTTPRKYFTPRLKGKKCLFYQTFKAVFNSLNDNVH
jgi:hypothetical protein